jgi:hypothetical protein
MIVGPDAQADSNTTANRVNKAFFISDSLVSGKREIPDWAPTLSVKQITQDVPYAVT